MIDTHDNATECPVTWHRRSRWGYRWPATNRPGWYSTDGFGQGVFYHNEAGEVVRLAGVWQFSAPSLFPTDPDCADWVERDCALLWRALISEYGEEMAPQPLPEARKERTPLPTPGEVLTSAANAARTYDREAAARRKAADQQRDDTDNLREALATIERDYLAACTRGGPTREEAGDLKARTLAAHRTFANANDEQKQRALLFAILPQAEEEGGAR